MAGEGFAEFGIPTFGRRADALDEREERLGGVARIQVAAALVGPAEQDRAVDADARLVQRPRRSTVCTVNRSASAAARAS
ncbi:hypothetical protein ACWGR4_33685 [Embleya sp. NPDC055664]